MAKKSNEIKPGLRYRGHDQDPWYVVNLFEDNGETLVVVKSWAKHRRHWIYKVEMKDLLQEWLNYLAT
jgi:hypothetical protein